MRVVAVAFLALLVYGQAPAPDVRDSLRRAAEAAARRSWTAADSLFRAAIDASPTSTEPWIRYSQHLRARDRWLALGSLARQAASRGPRGVEGRCLQAVLHLSTRGAVSAVVDSAVVWWDSSGAGLCVSFVLAHAAMDGELPPARTFLARAYLDRFIEVAPDLGVAYARVARYLEDRGETQEALAVVARGLSRADISPLARVRLQETRIRVLRLVDPAAARQLERSQDAALRRSRLPEVVDASRFFRARAAAWRAASPEEVEQAWMPYVEDPVGSANPDRVTQALLRIGMAYSGAGRYDRSLPHFRAALARASEAGLIRNLGRVHWRLGRDLLALGRVEEAEIHLTEARSIAETHGLLGLAAEVAHNLAHLREAGSDDDAASAAYDRFIRRSERLGRRSPLHLMALRDAGEFHRRRGRLATAMRLFDRMIDRIDAADAQHYWAAEYLESRGEIGRAVTYYERSLRSGGDIGNRARGALARLAALEGRWRDAERLAREHDARGPVADELPLLPSILAYRGAHLDAARALGRWAGVKARTGDRRGVYRARLAQASALLDGGDMDGAESVLTSLRRPAHHANIAALPDRERFLRARVEVARGRPRRAESILRSVLERALAEKDVELTIDVGALLGTVLTRQGRSREALAVLAGAAERADAWSGSVADPLRAVHLRRRVAEPIDLGLTILLQEAQPDVPEILAWSARRKAVSWSRMTDAHDRLRPENVPDGWLVMDFITLADGVWLAAIDRHGAALRRLAISSSRLDSLVTALVAPFTAVNSGHIDLARLALDRDAARRLYRALIGPVEGRIDRAAGIMVMPDGPLFGLPFSVLPGDAEDRYLVEDVAIAYALDARAAKKLPGPGAGAVAAQSPSVLAVGGQAPGAEREIAAVARMFGGTGLLSPSAMDLLARLPGARLVHFAAHAEGDPLDPRNSRLVLGDVDDPDGILDLARLGRLDLDAALVFLSACSTGRGSRARGSGVLSLASVFLDAGGGSVVATHWPVGAAAGSLADAFYEAWWTRQRAMPESLRAAKLRLLEDPATAHPFFWAPFALYLKP